MHVTGVAAQLPAVLTPVLPVAREIATVPLQVARVALQLVPPRDHASRVAGGPRTRDRPAVVPDLPAITGDLALAIPNLVPVGFQLTAVVAYFGAAYFGAWMRGLSGERTGGREDDGGAEEE